MSESSSHSEIFPIRLRRVRDLRNLNQSELADITGLQASAISQFENGARKPSFDNLKRLADALKVTTDYLLGRVNDPAGLTGAEEIYRNLEKLTDSDRIFAEKLIENLANIASKGDKKG